MRRTISPIIGTHSDAPPLTWMKAILINVPLSGDISQTSQLISSEPGPSRFSRETHRDRLGSVVTRIGDYIDALHVNPGLPQRVLHDRYHPPRFQSSGRERSDKHLVGKIGHDLKAKSDMPLLLLGVYIRVGVAQPVVTAGSLVGRDQQLPD